MRTRITPLAAALALLLTTSVATAQEARRVTLEILHTNDLHGHVGHAPAIATVVREHRRKNPHALFFDAGDCITGTPLSTLFQGRPVFDVMSRMGYDAVALGNHEFDHGWQLIAEFRERASFPVLCANAKDPDGADLGDAPHQVFDVDGVKVGVIGLVTDDVPTLTTAAVSKGCTFPSPIATARRLVPEVRKQADVIVLLTHYGVEEDSALAGAVDGIDLIVGGHSHTELKKAIRVGDTYIVQALSYGRRLGVAEMTWDTGERKVVKFANRLVTIDPRDVPGAPDVLAEVRKWDAQVEGKVGKVIGKTDVRLDRNRLRRHIERIYKELLGADFGYQNMGGLRSTIDAGDIAIRDIWTVLPFDNTLVRLTLTGDQVPKFVRKKLGSKFDPTRGYVFATNSYVGDQRQKYFGAAEAPVEETGMMMRDAVVAWVEKHGGFEASPGAADDEPRKPDPGEPR